jgi:hypothetical protein
VAVSFELSLESLLATRPTRLSFEVLVEQASLLVEAFKELAKVRAVGMHAIRDSLQKNEVACCTIDHEMHRTNLRDA